MRSMSVRMLAALSLAAAPAIMLGVPATAAEPVNQNAHGCWYYSDNGFQGARAKIVAGSDLSSLGAEFNDRVSSLTCHPLCTLVAYEGENHSGAKKSFKGDVRFVGSEWDDKISSMTVSCRRRARSIG